MERILFIEKWHSKGGGVQRVNMNLATEMSAKGIKPLFYVYDDDPLKSDGLVDLKTKFDTYSPDASDSFFKKLRHLFSLIKKEKIRYIIAATETANILATLCAFRFIGVNVIYTRHCAFDVSDQKLSPLKIKILYNLYALTGHKIGAVSSALKSEIQDSLFWRKDNVKFLPNAVVSPHVADICEINTDEVNYPDYICAVGRMTEQKGFDLLLSAYAKALAMNENSNLPLLVIVGDGELGEALIQQSKELGISDKVIFHGYTTNPYYIIANAEAFILSSRHEGMPTVLIEAMYLNTPVVSFDCPTGPSEIIKQDENGILIENGNVESLAFAIANEKWKSITDTKENVKQFECEKAIDGYLNELGFTVNG